jgi:NAD(P)-dependent dehydrogenase (short-subunit alcohol dehydrogenase family)
MDLLLKVALARGMTGTAVTVNSALVGPARSEGVPKFLVDIAAPKSLPVAEVEKDFFKTLRLGSLLQRFAATDEIAPMVAFLASPLSIATNGAALRVEGGCITTIL